MKELLIKLKACEDAREWAGDKTIEQIVGQCHRGDWLLWLAARVEIGLQPLTLAKGYCANTVRHLMKDERSVKAVDTAIALGEGKASRQELDSAAAAAAYNAATSAAYNAAAYNSAAAAAAAYNSAAYAADYAAAYAAYAADSDTSAAKQNQMQTADICRKYIGELIIEKCNEFNTKEK